jgi:hypothetical protein
LQIIMFHPKEQEQECTGIKESLLRSEIRFWRELIDSLDRKSGSAATLERMQQALALAEYRLVTLRTEESEAPAGFESRGSKRVTN